jgi:hypothetical protein
MVRLPRWAAWRIWWLGFCEGALDPIVFLVARLVSGWKRGVSTTPLHHAFHWFFFFF